MIIQFILVFIIVLIIIRSWFQLKSKKISTREFFLWLIIWLSAVVIVVYPKIASWLATQVGVGRGADLIVYVSIILIFYLLFRLLMRIEKMEKDITNIIREIALKNNKSENEK